MSEASGRPSSEGLVILHVVAPAPFGGAESVVEALAAGLMRRGHDVGVAAVFDLELSPHPFELALARAGVEVLPIRQRARAYMRERRAIAEICRRMQPQVVHTHGYRADVQAGFVARRLGLPAVSTVHGFTGGDWKNRCYEWLQQRALRRSRAVIAVSRPLAERLAAADVPADRLHLLPNAWRGWTSLLARDEARRELGLPHDAFVVGWVGRLSFEKGADVLLEALARLRDPRFIACVIGDGPERARLEQRILSLGLDERARLIGAVPDAGRFFAAFDAFALSSRTEGTPIVLFEAMDAGVPVVATAVGGVPDVVDARHAWLVPPEDPRALADALAKVRSDRREVARRTEEARSRLAEAFDLARWLDAHERIYREIG